jgi:hypothetical protein
MMEGTSKDLRMQILFRYMVYMLFLLILICQSVVVLVFEDGFAGVNQTVLKLVNLFIVMPFIVIRVSEPYVQEVLKEIFCKK